MEAAIGPARRQRLTGASAVSVDPASSRVVISDQIASANCRISSGFSVYAWSSCRSFLVWSSRFSKWE